MNKLDFLAYLMIGFILAICGYIYWNSDSFQLKCIISSVDGNKYCVRERNKIKPAANLLAKVTMNCKQLVLHMKEKYPSNSSVLLLSNGFNPKEYIYILWEQQYHPCTIRIKQINQNVLEKK